MVGMSRIWIFAHPFIIAYNVDVIFWVSQFLFLMQIYKGYEFGKPKEEVPEGVQE